MEDLSFTESYFDMSCSKNRPTFTDEDIMKKSIIGEGFHTMKRLPSAEIPHKKKKKKNVIQNELSEEVKNDLEVIRMRSVLDNKRFYKRNVTKGMKNVQVGRVLDSPADFYHSRLPKKLRKKTLVDELLADAKFKKDIKKRYVQIIEEKKDKYKKKHRLLKMKNKRK